MYKYLLDIKSTNDIRDQKGAPRRTITVVMKCGTTYKNVHLVETRTTVTMLTKELERGRMEIAVETSEISAVEMMP